MYYCCQIQRALRSTWRCCTARNMFIVNCLVLTINVLFYAVNSGFLFGNVESYFLPSLDSESKALLDRTFRVFVDSMGSANITFFIFSGSLLGSFRHHGPIPWDDDIDVIINSTDQNRVFEALSRTDPVSFELFTVHSDAPEDYTYQWKFYPKSGERVFLKRYRTPYIDIFFFYENRTHIWNGSPYFVTTEVWRKSLVFPLRRRQFGELMVPAPCNTEAFLASNFEVSVCQSRDFSHTYDMHFLSSPLRVPCERLHNLYPFVHRSANNSTSTQEALVYRGFTIRQVSTEMPC